MKRPALIPADVWENLTIADAARAGLLGAFPDELLRNKTDLLRDCGDWTMVARLLSENIDDESVRNACRIVRTRDKPNRPRRIPADIWDAMPVREACDHEFFSRPHDGKDLHLNTCLHMFPTDSFIGQSIARKLKRIDDRTLEIRFRVIREERAQRRQASCQKHEMVPGGDACVHCGMIIYAPTKRIQGAKADMVLVDDHVVLDRAKRADRCTRHEVYTMNGIAYCSRCNVSESEILDAVLEPLLEEDEQDIHHDLHVHTCTNCFENEQCTADCTIEPDLGTTTAGIPKGSHIRCAACGPEPEEPEPPRFVFREDICRNDGSLLPPFEAGEPADRVTVNMLYPQIGQGAWESKTCVRCSITSRSQPLLDSVLSISANGPAVRWSASSNDKAWREIAFPALRFDLAARTGEHLAVAAYGLILFALSVGAEHEREQVRAVMSATDDAMDAVMRTVREASEGE
jgi:hypothetical protein